MTGEDRRRVVSVAEIRVFTPVHLLMTVLCALAVCPGVTRAEWQSFGPLDGLADNNIRVVLEDGSENLWFGTNGHGVSRFDGVSWTTYTTADGLADNTVCSMIEDSSGNLWFGTGGGVSCYDGVSWATYTTAHGLAGDSVYGILQDGSGNLWFGTSGGVSRYDGTNWVKYTTADGLADNVVYVILEDGSGDLWIGTMFGASRFDGATWTTYTTADGLAYNCVIDIAEDGSGDLWFATIGAVSRFDGLGWTTYASPDWLADTAISEILEDGSGDLWFGTDGRGVSCFDGLTWTTYTTVAGLVGDFVTSILEDNSGNLWFGTWGQGVSRYDRASWTTYTTADGLGHDWVAAIAEDSSGSLWFGTMWGVTRYDHLSWTTYTTADGLANNSVIAVLEDGSGSLWFGTHAGVSRYDGMSWTTYTTADGLANDSVCEIIEDSSGAMWFGTLGGVSRYDGASWTTYTTADGLPDSLVVAVLEDGSGSLWFGTQAGVSRYDGISWTTYTTADGLAGNRVRAIAEDGAGSMWFGTDGGVSRYDGVSWTTYTTAEGLADNSVSAIIEDSSGNLWFGTSGGVSRYDGVSWTTYTTADGLAYDYVCAVLEDTSGDLWFGTHWHGVSAHEPDRVAPQTVISPRPSPLTIGRTQTIVFAAAYGELWGIRFSHSFDGAEWSAWATPNTWTASGLSDGNHVFEVRARDVLGNVDPTPATFAFEVDATAPAPVIAAPAFGEAVRDSIAIQGTAADLRFEHYSLEVRALGWSSWTLLGGSLSPVVNGVLGGWNTARVPDGEYELRLSVVDTLGLTGAALVEAVVDNEAPWAWETSPVTISASSGGDVYTTNREVHLYFPPHALAGDASVSVIAAVASSVPDTLPGGAALVQAGHEISWQGVSLEKQAVLDVAVGERAREGVLALYVLPEGGEWERVGGTLAPDGSSIAAAVAREGTYALYSDFGGPVADSGLSDVSFTPRVFSPSGSFARSEVAIGFSLGRSGPVAARVYNRAGRLVRELASGLLMNTGVNVVRWDGSDDSGAVVPDGLYLVSVEALGEKAVRTLAVVR